MAAKVLKFVAKTRKPRATGGTAPKWLSKTARAEWERLVVLLEEKGTLTRENRPLLADYCGSLALIAECDRELSRSKKLVLRGAGGVARPHPLIGARNRASQNAISLAKKLGILGAATSDPSKGGAGSADAYSKLGI